MAYLCVRLQEGSLLSWSQRVRVVKEASTALQFLHCPPEGHRVLIHGDVKRLVASSRTWRFAPLFSIKPGDFFMLLLRIFIMV